MPPVGELTCSAPPWHRFLPRQLPPTSEQAGLLTPASRPWTVTVQDLENDPASTIELINGGAIATASTQKRRWARDGQGWHHIINPATGLSATPDLATVSVIAGSATEANTYSTAAIVWESSAHQKLAPTGLPTRLVTVTGTEPTHHWPATPTPQP